MRNTGLFMIMMLGASTLTAQVKQADSPLSGRITYEEKLKLEIKLEGDAAQFASMLPSERKAEKILLFNEEGALYQDGNNNAEEAMVASSHTEGVRIRMVSSAENKTYTDLKNNIVLDQRDFMNRIFIVEKPVSEPNWKITGNQKVILGQNCMEAIKTDTAGIKTIAWFAPGIAIKAGPAGLGSLPGIILEADINNGSRTYTAKAIEQIPAAQLKIEKPKDGKKVTEAEYNQIMAEKLKEMGMEQGKPGSGAQMHIIIKQ